MFRQRVYYFGLIGESCLNGVHSILLIFSDADDGSNLKVLLEYEIHLGCQGEVRVSIDPCFDGCLCE